MNDKDESNILLLLIGALTVGVGVIIGFFITGGFKHAPTPQSVNPSGWMIDRDAQGRPSAIISLPTGIIQ